MAPPASAKERPRMGSRDRGLSRFAWGLLGYEILVVAWGGYVRASGSGAGCGRHWPMCNGEILPRAPRIETLIELSHRVSSGGALVGHAGAARLGVSRLSARASGAPGRRRDRVADGRRGPHRRGPRALRARRARRLDEARAQHQPAPGQHVPPPGVDGAHRVVGHRGAAGSGCAGRGPSLLCWPPCSARCWSSARAAR